MTNLKAHFIEMLAEMNRKLDLQTCPHTNESRENIDCCQDGSGVAEFTCTDCGNTHTKLVDNARSSKVVLVQH